MSDTTEPAVPLLAPSTTLMSLSMAMRQAAIDAAALPKGLRFAYTMEQGKGGQLVVTIKAENAFGVVVWEQPYDGRGHRLTVGGGIDF